MVLKNNIKKFISQSTTLRQAAIASLGFAALLITSNAQADLRKAIEAFQTQDGSTMLVEVREAVERKNDDGVILFLSLLKGYPQSWRSVLSPTEQDELFTLLEKLIEESSLQAQYRLAIIPRGHASPRYKSPEAQQAEQALIHRLEAVADKGYAYAALHLYSILSNKERDWDIAVKWLKVAAEGGNPEAAFFMGMKYLNVFDGYWGCFTRKPHRCLPKDEELGWQWMKMASRNATHKNIPLGDFGYEMGKLYEGGVTNQSPDEKQAYLWFRVAFNGLFKNRSRNEVASELKEIKKSGLLETLDPELNAIWETNDGLAILQNPPKKLPSLLETMRNNLDESIVFSYISLNRQEPAVVLDVYKNGKVNLLSSDYWLDLGNNPETWKKVTQQTVDSFLQELKKLDISSDLRSVDHLPFLCEDGCPQFTAFLISFLEDDSYLTSFITGQSDPRVIQLLALIEKYFSVQEYLQASASK
jgi:hypothetical protein